MPFHLSPDVIRSSGLAYVDPGAGSLLIQAAIAALISVPFLLRSRLSALARRVRSRGSADSGVRRSGQD
jgi:hypothetical protein